MLHLLLAFSAHGAIEQCVYTSSSPGAPVGDDWLVTVGDDCTGTGTCTTISDAEIDKCTPADSPTDASLWIQTTCSDGVLTVRYHAKQDCSDDVSTKCVFDTPGSLSGCTLVSPLDQCIETFALGSVTAHTKLTGSCPGDDKPCFSREAEACRILDTSVTPSAAFRACFDEPVPTVAERVKMTALAGGDYVLSAGKELAYEFTRVIVNQHKLSEARYSTSSTPSNIT